MTYYSDKILSYSPLALWILAESAGSTADNAEGTASLDGTYNGVSLANDTFLNGANTPLWDGINDRCDLPAAAINSAINKSEGTLIAWFKVADSGVWTDGTDRTIAILRIDDNNELIFWKSSTSNRFDFRFQCAGASKGVGKTGVSDTDWIMVATTWSVSSDEVRHFWNGVQEGSTQTTISAFSGTFGTTGIGNRSTTWIFDGWISHVSLFDSVLSPAEIADIYDWQEPTSIPSGNFSNLGMQIFEDPNEDKLIIDVSELVSGGYFETDEHGDSLFNGFISLNKWESLRIVDTLINAHLVISGTGPIYKGRIEDVMAVPLGAGIKAIGYWQAFTDFPYTNFWSTKLYRDWRAANQEQDATRNPSLYAMDNNNRLFAQLRPGTIYRSTDDLGAWYYIVPDDSGNDIAVVEYDYDVKIPSGWSFQIRSLDKDYGSGVTEATVVSGDGAVHTATSQSETITAGKQIVEFRIFNNSGDDYNMDKEQIGVTWGSAPDETEGSQQINANTKGATQFVAARTFYATKMRVYFLSDFASGENAKLGIYSDSGGSPNTLLGVSDEINGDGRDGYKTVNLDAPVAIGSGTTYWLAVITDANASVRCYNTGHTSNIGSSDTYSNGFASPWSGGSSGTLGLDIQAFADEWYMKVTNVRVKGTSSASVYADEIIADMLSSINTINPEQLSSETGLIESPALDLDNVTWEDTFPADVANELAVLGDGVTEPWEIGVDHKQRVYFRERASQAREWYTDVVDFEIELSLNTLVNSSYTVYQDENGRTMRTAVYTDQESNDRFNIRKRIFIRSTTTSETFANNLRTRMVTDRSQMLPRARIVTRGIYDQHGSPYPNYAPRSGDRLNLRNLPPIGSPLLERLRSFTLRRTRYILDSDTFVPTPGLDIPGVEIMVARSEIERLQSSFGKIGLNL